MTPRPAPPVLGADRSPAGVTVVLVHGEFVDSASWSRVIEGLDAVGVTAVAASNPLRGVVSDAESVRAAIASQRGPVVLVGHSYGGSVITLAAVDNPAVISLVFVSAFAPATGESAITLTEQFPGSSLGASVRPYPLGDGTNDLVVDRSLYRSQVAADVSPERARIMAATQRPILDSAMAEPLAASLPAWKSVPSWFVFGSADRNVPVAALRSMALRAEPKEIREIEGASHSPMMSHPEVVVEVIVAAVSSRS